MTVKKINIIEVTCDRCGAKTDDQKKGNFYPQSVELEITHEIIDAHGNGTGGHWHMDLCADCTAQFLKFLKPQQEQQ